MTCAPIREDESDAVEPAAPACGLYTETLARLYVQQGYDAKALAIYRHLVALQPDNAGLRAKADALARQLATGDLDDTSLTGDDQENDSRVLQPSAAGNARLIAHLERWLGRLRRQRQKGAAVRP